MDADSGRWQQVHAPTSTTALADGGGAGNTVPADAALVPQLPAWPRARNRHSAQLPAWEGTANDRITVPMSPSELPLCDVWPEQVPEALSVRYDQFELLGSGGCGVVYRARDLMLGRDVVLKFLKPDSSDIQRSYFLREVRLAGSLTHQNILQVYDIGTVEGRLYYVMQFVPGRTLGDIVRDGPMPWATTVRIVRELCDALDHAHAKGILHRDVKPENVLLGDDGAVRLFDFGLARLKDAGFGKHSMVVGTPSHMAPEQIRGDAVDHHTDIYGVGVVAYELLTGRLPFMDGNMLLAHTTEPVPDPRTFRPDLPAAVTAVLTRALAKHPGDRFSSCGALATALGSALA